MPPLLRIVTFVAALAVSLGQEKLDRLLVFGDGFAFGVKEPSGWQGDTDAANSIGANILFCKKGESVRRFSALIYVRINEKTDEDLSGDLKADMDGYKREHPDVEFRDLVATHPDYAVYSKLFVLPRKSFEYVAYVNPGKGKPLMFSVAMNVPKREAYAEELKAYQAVLSSLTLIKPQHANGADSPVNRHGRRLIRNVTFWRL
jgi:hypothetical protein